MTAYSSIMETPEGFFPGTWPRIKQGDNFLTQGRLYRATKDAYREGGLWVIEAETPEFEYIRIQHNATDLGYAPSVFVDRPQNIDEIP